MKGWKLLLSRWRNSLEQMSHPRPTTGERASCFSLPLLQRISDVRTNIRFDSGASFCLLPNGVTIFNVNWSIQLGTYILVVSPHNVCKVVSYLKCNTCIVSIFHSSWLLFDAMAIWANSSSDFFCCSAHLILIPFLFSPNPPLNLIWSTQDLLVT